MPELDQVMQCVLEAVAELNEQLEPGRRLDVAPETTLLGASSSIDSLGLVNLILLVEEKLEEGFDQPLSLSDEKAMSQTKSPFRSVRSLAEYARGLLQEKACVNE